jgi:hypothetical protein
VAQVIHLSTFKKFAKSFANASKKRPRRGTPKSKKEEEKRSSHNNHNNTTSTRSTSPPKPPGCLCDMLPHLSPDALLRALRLGLAPLVFWQVTKRERKAFEQDLTPEKVTSADKSNDKKNSGHGTPRHSAAATSRHVAELETPLRRTPGTTGGVMMPDPWWSRVRTYRAGEMWGGLLVL